jgi:hypothetical protein
MQRLVIIIHGWSDTSRSFQGMAKRIEQSGAAVVQVRLSDYMSKEDDVAIEDVTRRMDQVLRQVVAGTPASDIRFIAHSTGALVVRHWLVTYGSPAHPAWPRAVVQLAPANFGSALAAKGQSFLGRVVKGYDNWFETGLRFLRALEPSSPFQWQLTARDLLHLDDGDANGSIYGSGDGQVMVFTLIGDTGYKGLRGVANEAGSDGTIRIAAANMNVAGARINFAVHEQTPQVTPLRPRFTQPFPLCIIPGVDHTSIVGSNAAANTLLNQALQCQPADYAGIASSWHTLNNARSVEHDGSAHALLLVRVRDQYGDPVDDYFAEFGDERLPGDEDSAYIQRHVFENVSAHTIAPSHRAFYIDQNKLDGYHAHLHSVRRLRPTLLTLNPPARIEVSLSATPVGPHVRYFNSTRTGASGVVPLWPADQSAVGPIAVNSPFLLDIIIPRIPADDVFRM